VLASAAVLVMTTSHARLKAQTSSQFQGPSRVAPATLPENDAWPVAATDDLGTIQSPQSLTFTGATLLANDSPANAVTIVSEDLQSAYSVSWDTRLVPNGTHRLSAVARDAAGNTSTAAAVVVNVANTVTTLSGNVITARRPAGIS
jgi:hypothetical protein